MTISKLLVAMAFLLVGISHPTSAQQEGKPFRAGAVVFVETMSDGFDESLKSAFTAKKVPLSVVGDRSLADFVIRGSAETNKAGTAKKLMLNFHSDEQASIAIIDARSGQIVFAYSANKKNSAHCKQSSAEACAKHIKERLDKGK